MSQALDVLLVGAEELENLSTRYLAAVLRKRGYSVRLAAFSTEDDREAVVRVAQACRPRLIGLSVIFQYRAPEFLRLAAALRHCLPDTHGFHLVGASHEYVRDTVDAVRRFEPRLVVPTHCTGFKSQAVFAAHMPDQFVLGSVGTTYLI